jgi:hypothetical protein
LLDVDPRNLPVCYVVESDRRRRVGRLRAFRRITFPAFWESSALTPRASAKVRFRPNAGREEATANLIRQRGNEYGSVTKRPRRCGWFDAVATRYAAELNGFDSVALTKLDVLDALDENKSLRRLRN